MRRLLGMILCLLLAGCAPALAADDVFTVTDLAGAQGGAWDEGYIASNLTSDRSYLRLDTTMNEEVQVVIGIADEDGALVYQRDYGLCSGRFRSEDIYLRLAGSQTTYQVSVQLGDTAYTFPIRRVMPRLKGNEACSVGYPLSALSGVNSWKTATMLEVSTMEGVSVTTPMHASGAYNLGTVTFTVRDGSLKVSAEIDGSIDGQIDGAAVYVATSALEAENLGRSNFYGLTGGLNEAISLYGAQYAAVYVKLTVSFNPAGVPGSPETTLPGQDEVWQVMRLVTANEAVG